MTLERTTRILADRSGPIGLVAGSLLVIGSVHAAAGSTVLGWPTYLLGNVAALPAILALAALHGARLGRLGAAGLVLVVAGLALGLPTISMVAALILGLTPLHDALMPYAMSPLGMFGGIVALVGLVPFGLAIVRAGAVPASAGWLLATAGLVALAAEVRVLPIVAWPVATVLVYAALARIAVVHSRKVAPGPSVVPLPQPSERSARQSARRPGRWPYISTPAA